MMRKFFWGFAALPLLALLATSCNKETVESKGDNVLAFKAATGKQTLGRAAEVNLADLQDEELTVESYKATDHSLYNEFILSYGTEWTYSPIVFHPTGFGLNHYSAHPAQTLTNTSGVVTFDYTVEDDADTQEDLMVASASTTAASPAAATANLTYKHILSQVNFAIQGKENLIVEITDIQVVGVKNAGTFTFNTIGATGDAGTWALTTDVDDYAYTSVNGDATDGTDDILYLGNPGGSSGNTNTNALMLMPQSFAAGDVAGFTFNYELRNLNGGDVIESGSATVNFADLSMKTWNQGKRYLYIIIFDPILLQFTVDIEEDWVDYNTTGGLINVER